MTKEELAAIPQLLRTIAKDYEENHYFASQSMLKAAEIIEKQASIINRAKVEFFRNGSDSKVMQRMIQILNEMP